MLALQRVLSFANSMSELDTRQSNGRRPIRLEVQHRSASPFDGSMVLLDHVIEISARPDLCGPPPGIFLREQAQGPTSGAIPVEVDFARPKHSGSGDGFSEERLRCLHAAIIAERRRY
jgi:hypothetical protein